MAIEIPKDLIKAVIQKACELGFTNIAWNDNVKGKKAVQYCGRWIQPFIFSTGEVIPCCAQNEANERKWQRENSLGNVFKTPFKFLWHSDKYKAFRQDIISGRLPRECSKCPLFEEQKKC